jgi:hypothetical protein
MYCIRWVRRVSLNPPFFFSTFIFGDLKLKNTYILKIGSQLASFAKMIPTILFLSLVFQPTNTYAKSCSVNLSLGNHYYGVADSAHEIGLLNYEKAFYADNRGDYELACEYLSLSRQEFVNASLNLDLAESVLTEVVNNCESAQKSQAQLKIGYSQQLLTDVFYYQNLVERELSYQCK